jgi:prophage regulatory protein
MQPKPDPKEPQTILRLPAVSRVTGLRKSAIYDGIARGKFPKPIPLDRRAVGWLETEISEWQRARIAQRDGDRS